ncbi:glycosyltransferase family 2 protein [Lentisphaerota bacterium WC36G]|nr:glycosyltransferase family 2 protein [Lentisphaerae bacterium WC36]UDQ98841.1 glycosyltransferase family 2 protein [Lentisphaerae bacterium WC36]
MSMPIVNIVIPTYNAGVQWKLVLEGLAKQSYPIEKKILIDTSSGDNTIALAEEYGFEITKISKQEFNHGLTRNLGLNLTTKQCDLVLFMTQDAILNDHDAIKKIVKAIDSNNNIAMAYGRQIPRENATKIEKFVRSYNYPANSKLKTFSDSETLGIKTAFCSNSFALYCKDKFLEMGGFRGTNFGEDMLLAADFLMKGWGVYYCAEAEVVHSHNNSLSEEFKRNLHIGKMHKENSWLINKFGKPQSEGKKLLAKAFNELSWWEFYKFLIYCTVRYCGYKLGNK